MKKTPIRLISKNKKVVHLQLDASFFFERAVRSLDRHRYDKAVKYFRLAMEKEPDNPVNHCNLAGILSELGRFEESNEVLEMVVSEVEPKLYECYFYMANNSANMGDFELAEEYLLDYLSFDPEGEYAVEAEDMLYMVAYELGRPPREPISARLPSYLLQHDEARQHLEEGHFLQATEILETLIEQHPDFLAARNNLALAYYYTGRLSEAMKCIHEVLEVEPSNLHALCNLAVLSKHMNEVKISCQLIDTLKKLVPFHQEHAYKLATTMGILGEHEVAYELFTRLAKLEEQAEPSLYHYAAAASFNTGRLQQAKKYWKKAALLDPDSDIPRFYLGQLQEWSQRLDESLPVVSYHYHLPFEEQMLQMDQMKPNKEWLEKIKNNPLLRSSFFWALHHGDYATKLQVLHVLGWIGDAEVEQLLRDFLLRRQEDEELKKVALLILKHLEATPPYQVWLHDQVIKVGDEEIDGFADLDEDPVWQCCLENLGTYDSEYLDLVKHTWQQCKIQVSEIHKAEAWSAALEYFVLKQLGQAVTQQQVADKYHVSLSTVSRKVREIHQLTRKSEEKEEKEEK
ncbi:tetratricopeptide repeat protein [Hazenella coriacea]|uniref:Tetratricopeptide repeat protein n=1 Tax=Hazenella coriacea TaxID=1179467 RepID=A0A4R3L819_9BACL|nr:tetratricopeptide repeat protein [Hazenella coriacea]TCS95702.1 tetratricopeptide repeat protein [Hazenella coriacea]